MKRIVISSTGYYSNTKRSNEIIEMLIEKNSGHTVLLNIEEVSTSDSDALKNEKCEIVLIKYKDLEKDNKISNQFLKLKICNKSIVLVDLSGIYGEKVHIIIENLKREVLMLDKNIVALGIICDDLEIPIVLDRMLLTFRVAPMYLNDKDINKRIEIIKRKAFILKYLNRSILFKIFKKIYFKIRGNK